MASTLLSLPVGLLGTHVWPLLGPGTQAQLRATCQQLRAAGDGLLGPELCAYVPAEVGPSAWSSLCMDAASSVGA